MYAHERAGKAAAHTAAASTGGQRDVLAGWGSHHHLAGFFAAEKIDDGTLPGEDSARGEGYRGSESGARARFRCGGRCCEISSAILSQLVVWGRSSGPRAGAAAA